QTGTIVGEVVVACGEWCVFEASWLASALPVFPPTTLFESCSLRSWSSLPGTSSAAIRRISGITWLADEPSLLRDDFLMLTGSPIRCRVVNSRTPTGYLK